MLGGKMNALFGTMFFAIAVTAPPSPDNWCRVGHTVMIPDGREGPVTSLDGEICGVLVYGEKYVSQWAYYLVEPIYPQKLERYQFGH
jgi:hypothetical protein